MKIKEIPDSDFSLVEIKEGTPHCKKHGAMNKVSRFSDGDGGYWRCVSTVAIGKDNCCNAGCCQINS